LTLRELDWMVRGKLEMLGLSTGSGAAAIAPYDPAFMQRMAGLI